jgi:DNA polymerase III subunit epsilon
MICQLLEEIKLDFVAIDFETANPQKAPCSLGITLVKNGEIQNCFSYLINPKESFAEGNIRVHGIQPEDVIDSPEFPEIWTQISDLFVQYPLVAHNAIFDRSVLIATLTKYNIPVPEMTFYCTMHLAQQNFPNIPKYGLSDLCDYFKLSLTNHHCCDADSIACASLLLKMMDFPNFKLDALSKQGVTSYSKGSHSKKPVFEEAHILYDNLSDFTFSDKSFVITGDVGSYDRKVLFEMIEGLGGTCRTAVSRKTDYLIVGMQDKTIVKDKSNVKSENIIKAEQLQQEGYPIKIISDEDFLQMLNWMQGISEDTSTDWFSFRDDKTKYSKLKFWGLMPETSDQSKQIYYNGIYSDGLVKCDVIGYVDSSIAVIDLNNSPHKIHFEYLSQDHP